MYSDLSRFENSNILQCVIDTTESKACLSCICQTVFSIYEKGNKTHEQYVYYTFHRMNEFIFINICTNYVENVE